MEGSIPLQQKASGVERGAPEAPGPRARVRLGVPKIATPPGTVLVGAACVGFVVVAAVISLITGAPFVLPTESVSPALGFNYAFPVAIGIGGYFLAQVFYRLVRRARQPRSSWRAHLAWDGYFVVLFIVVIFVHFHIKMWVPIINPELFDDTYYAIDNHLGVLLSVFGWLHSELVLFLPVADSLYQTGLLAMLILAFWFHGFGGRVWHYHNLTSIILIEIIGPLTYLIAPAVGPFIYESGPYAETTAAQQVMYQSFQGIRQYGVGWLNEHGGGYFTSPLAAMPSLHVAAGWVLTYYAIKARLVIAPVMLCVFGMLIIDSIVLRWHYLIDIPMGLLLAVVTIGITNRVCRR